MRPLRPLLVALAFVGACAHTHFVPTKEHGWSQRRDGTYVYLPPGFSPSQHLPIIVFLHGADERGHDPLRVTQVGLGPTLERLTAAGTPLQAVVLFPQCPSGRFWAETAPMQLVLDALDSAAAEYQTDPDRVYLTGNSMGGYGSWIIAGRNPGKVAAIVPICGGLLPPPGMPLPKDAASFARAADPFAALAEALGPTPVWAFHGADDWVVPPKQDRQIIAALRARGQSKDIRYTELAKTGHWSWDKAYAEPGLWTWLLAQHRQP